MQTRRAKEAQLDAERAISDKQRELEQTQGVERRAHRAGRGEEAGSAGLQRTAELDATQIAQAKADAERVRLEAQASADAEAIRIRTIADATAESIQKVNEAIEAGGESYFRYRQIEMLPQIAPAIAEALARRSWSRSRAARRARPRRRRTTSQRHPDGARRADGRPGRLAGHRRQGAGGTGSRQREAGR